MFEIGLFRFKGKDWGAGRDFDLGWGVRGDLLLDLVVLAHLLFLGVLQFLYLGFALAAYSEGKGRLAES